MKLDRLISIIIVLLRKERVQAKELADMFDVSVRTILRDVEAISLAGIPIVTYQGVNGGIGIAEGYRFDKSVLTEDEMAAIISTLKGVSKTLPDNRNEILIEKFKNSLTSPQLNALNSKVNQFVIDISPWGDSELIMEKVSAIRSAIGKLKEIEFDYTDSEGSKTLRRVEPYSLVLKSQKWYLYAWCCTRQDFRFFKLSRIKQLKILESSYNPREVSLEQYPWNESWQSSENTVLLDLVFEKVMESIVVEWFSEDVETMDDGRIMVRTKLPESNWLYGFLLSFGPYVEVINPPHIRKILAQMAEQIYKKYASKI